MAYNKANMGYIPAIVLKEIAAGREIEITGGAYAVIKNRKDYDDRKYRLIGLFGEIIGWKGKTTMIATRSISDCPEWVKEMVDQHSWDHPMMFRWQVPKEER